MVRRKAEALKRLPSARNGTRRNHSSFGLFEYQKEELRTRAHARGEGVSYYINSLLWADWLHAQERRTTRKRGKR